MTDDLKKTSEAFSRMDVPAETRSQALANLESWLDDGRFQDTRPQLGYLLQAGQYDQLFDSFFRHIPFGTSGRRGPVGYGTNRFNPFTLGTSIQGHCDFLQTRGKKNSPGVVIAYDVRVFNDIRETYNSLIPNPLVGMLSEDFARIAAGIYAANGIRVWFAPGGKDGYVTTPELSFAIRELGALGGLNVSASHNHPDDNGAKIYNAAGAQAVSPLDQELAESVERTTSISSISWDEAVAAGLAKPIPPEIHERYIETNLAISIHPSARSARIAFTPLHGTGRTSVEHALKKAGFEIQCLPSQGEPDGTFPTVPFHSANPEVRESMDLVTGFAREEGFDLALATDPDADRLGVAIPDDEDRWSFLDGNQIGLLLAAYLLESCPPEERGERFCVCTTVTTSLLPRLVRGMGAQSVNDLPTGFKYICEVLRSIEEHGHYKEKIRGSLDGFLLGTEESHGYLVTDSVRDKDATGASLLLAEFASRLKEHGNTLLGRLDKLYLEFGYTATRHASTVMLGARGHLNIKAIQASLRSSPLKQIGEKAVENLIDYMDEEGSFGPILSDTDRTARDILEFRLADGARVISRPSGTEPKHKIYVEVLSDPMGVGAPPEALRVRKSESDAIARNLADDFLTQMLDRIGISLPPWALDISDLVPLEWKQDFAGSVMPKLVSELTAGKSAGEVEEWVDQRLGKYGADWRLLVGDAVSAYCRQEPVGPIVKKTLERLFDIESRASSREKD